MRHSHSKTKANSGIFAPYVAIAIGIAFIAGMITYGEVKQHNLGASLQTQLSDTIGTFRTNVNTSLSQHDSDIASITSTQATYGTIVTENVPLANNKGGTGTTSTPNDLQYFGANGASVGYKTLTASSGITITTTTTSTYVSTNGLNPVFLNTTTSVVSSTGANNTPILATSTFTLSTAGRVLVIVTGSLTQTGATAAQGCELFIKVNGTEPSDFNRASFVTTATAGQQYNLSFSYITTSLSAATHNITLWEKNTNTADAHCQGTVTFATQYIGT